MRIFIVLKKSIFLSNLILVLGILIICGLSYGLTAGKLGYFLDDWYIVWTYRTFGTAKFVEFFRGDRPLFSLIYRIFIPIIKDSPLTWQLSAIFTKWLAALSLWALIRLLLPKKNWFAFSVAALFAVYPGFKFHYFAVMYAQNYTVFAVYFLSYIFMVLAVRNPNRRVLFTAFGLICQFIGIAPMELYYGLELVRPLIIYFTIAEESMTVKTRLIAAARLYLPYFSLFLGFTLFRVLFSGQLYSYQFGLLDQLTSAPLQTIKSLVLRTVRGWFDGSVNVWLQLRRVFLGTGDQNNNFLLGGLIAAAILAGLLVLLRTERLRNDGEKKKLLLWLVALGNYAVLVGMVPVIIAGLDVDLTFYGNRFLLPLSVGTCLLVVALVDLVFTSPKLKTIIVAALLALSVGENYLNGLEFQKAWETQKDFFAQLTWRAPQIKPGTVVITTDLPFSLYYSGTSLTAPLNMIYAPDLKENPIPYQFILAASPQMNSMPELLPDQAIDRTSRVFRFVGNTSDMISIYAPEQGCMQVISPETNPDSFKSDRYADLWADLIKLSDLSRIDTNATVAQLPQRYFGEVSTDTWCYYYQLAAYHEQKSEWHEVIKTFDQAVEKNFQPENPSEWLPLISAHVQLGNISTALSISEDLVVDDEFSNRGFCSLWQEVNRQNVQNEQQRIEVLLENWGCEKEKE